jgi:hypothetical protein
VFLSVSFRPMGDKVKASERFAGTGDAGHEANGLRRVGGRRGNGSAACSTSRAAVATSGADSTPSCSFLTSQPRLPLGTGLASSAAAKTRRPLRKNGARRADLAGCPTRQRWMMFCIKNAYEVAPSACIDATSMSCPMAHLPHSMERPSPFVATRSYTGRRKVTMLASRGRAVSLSMCSPAGDNRRPVSWLRTALAPECKGVLQPGFETLG